jgi:hypothetical protein
MPAERSWPHRFRVDVVTSAHQTVPYLVVTWLSEKKAIALAVMAHVRRYGLEGGGALYDVDVTDLGPVPRDHDGSMQLESRDLVDRMEF